MSDPRRPVAIVGAGGYIGQHFARLLADHPWFRVEQLVGGGRSVGLRLDELWALAEAPPPELAGRRLVAATPAALARAGIEGVFSALPSGSAKTFEAELVRRGVAVFSNAADHRLDPRAPLLIPEVNRAHLALAGRRPRGRGLLVTNANCSTTGVVVALAPVIARLRPRAVHVSTYQSLSGAGWPGVPSLAITDNVLPHIPAEEEKIARESARLLGRYDGGRIRPFRTPVVANCARVATREGHLAAVTVEASRSPPLDELTEAWSAFDPLADLDLPTAPHPPIVVQTAPDRPQPLRDRWLGSPARARGMAIAIGRIRWTPPYLRFFTLSHNAVRGGAGGSVLNAELSVALGIPWRQGARSR